jgi:hypothetical protein
MTNGQTAAVDTDVDTLQLLGPARLAYFTPVREYPPLGDKKASTLLSVDALMITVTTLFSHRLADLIHGGDAAGWLTRGLLVVWFVLMLGSAWNAFVALTLPIPNPELPGHEPNSLAFFKNIAALPLAAYEQELRRMTHRRALRDMLHYNYSLAILSVDKFHYIQRAVKFLCLAFGCWVFLMLALAGGSQGAIAGAGTASKAPPSASPAR